MKLVVLSTSPEPTPYIQAVCRGGVFVPLRDFYRNGSLKVTCC